MKDGIDLTARKVVMASMLYYGLDESVVADEEYDGWCLRLHKLWLRLDPFRQWQLGSRDEIKGTGFHVKVTMAAANAAIDWAKPKGNVRIKKDWEWSKRHRVHFLLPGDFELTAPKKRVRL